MNGKTEPEFSAVDQNMIQSNQLAGIVETLRGWGIQVVLYEHAPWVWVRTAIDHTDPRHWAANVFGRP